MADLSGTTLGKYQVIERLGRGGMADVYRAFQPTMDRFVAIKVMHPHLAEDQEFIERFKREARSVGGLRHPNIMQIIDFDIQNDVYYMVMEFLQGETLKTRLEKRGALGIPEALDIGIKLADALAFAHNAGIMHRDIKPANVLFTAKGEPILTDFGIARILGSTNLTSSGAMIGTPAYMSPEVGQGETSDARSDVYELGVVLYEMLTGNVPYDADTPFAVIIKHINDPLPPPRKFRTDLPQAVEALLYRALAKRPDDRYQTAAEFRDAMRELRDTIANTLSTQFNQSTPPKSTIAPAALGDDKTLVTPDAAIPSRQAGSPSPMIIGGVIVIILAVLVIGGLLMSRNTPPTGATTTPVVIVDATLNPTSAPTESATVAAIDVTPTSPFGPTPIPPLGDINKFAASILGMIDNGQYDTALAAVQAQLDALPADAPRDTAYTLYVLRGVVLVQYRDDEGKMKEAFASAGKALRLDPKRPEAYVVIGLYYGDSPLYDFARAVDYYTTAINNGMTDWTLFRLRARAISRMSNPDSARVIADLSKAIELAPLDRQDDVYWERGNVRQDNGDWEGAAKDYADSYRLNRSRSKEATLGTAYLVLGRHQEADALYTASIAENFENARFDPEYLGSAAIVAFYVDNLEEAAQRVDASLLLDPTTATAIYTKALMTEKQGNTQAALDLLNRLNGRDRNEWGNYAYFRELFNRNLEIDQARLMAELGKVPEAIALYEKTIQEQYLYNAQFTLELGRLYRTAGDLQKARETFVHALEVNANTGDDETMRKTLEDELRQLNAIEPTAEPTTQGN